MLREGLLLFDRPPPPLGARAPPPAHEDERQNFHQRKAVKWHEVERDEADFNRGIGSPQADCTAFFIAPWPMTRQGHGRPGS